MKNWQKLKYFVVGLLVATILGQTVVPVVAAGLEATLNMVNITMNGKIIAKAGENFMLSNGTQVPYSIVYNGTTYLPMRKVAELCGKEVSWDGATSTVGINDIGYAAPVATPTPTPVPKEEVIPITDLVQFKGQGFSQGATFKVRQQEVYAANCYNTPYTEGNSSTYILDKKYITISGTIAFVDGAKSYYNSYRLLRVIGDGQVLARLYTSEGATAYQFNIDVSGVTELTIECGGSIRFYNVNITKGTANYAERPLPIQRLSPYKGEGFNAGKFTFTTRQKTVEMFNRFNTPNTERNTTTYILDKKYTQLNGMLSFIDGASTLYSSYYTLKITGDGKVLYNSQVAENTNPFEMNVNLTGVDQLTIECGGSIFFYNVTVK